MSIDFASPRGPRRYLLVPAKPAANGGLHLGHAGGPYLRMDILARHLKRRGDDVAVIFGSDAYDSYVEMRADQEGTPTEILARRYHAQIALDLAALRIGVDVLIDPLAPQWRAAYGESYRSLVERLLGAGLVEEVEERLLYSPATSRFAVGCWLTGKCPDCGREVGGYFCEECGAHFQPTEMVDARPRDELGACDERTIRGLYMRVEQPARLLEQLAGTGVGEQFREVVHRHVRRRGSRVRLTIPAAWGLPWESAPPAPPVRLFGSGLLFGYCLLIGEAYRGLHPDRPNPFHADSDVLTVNLFGLDNVVSHMFSIQAVALADRQYKPFDYFVVNYFLTLNGEKFSTSRRHAIWCSDVVEQTPVTADAVRYYLASKDAAQARSDFDVDEFVAFVSRQLAGRLEARIAAERAQVDVERVAPPPPPHDLERLRRLLADQERSIEVSSFGLRGVVRALDDWIDAPVAAPYWWLKGFALLAWPLLPEVSGQLWRWLGGAGEPSLARFVELTRPDAGVPVGRFVAVSRQDLESCLPPTLRWQAGATGSAGPAEGI